MPTELILIRHGHAVRVNGDYVHAPLTALGQEQASRTGEHFSSPQNHLDGFYASPLRRTQETANIIGGKIGRVPELRPGVQELRSVELPALLLFEIFSAVDFVHDYLLARAGEQVRWPIEGRVSKALLEVVAKHPDQRVAVVAHSGVISAALAWYLPQKRWRWWRTTVSNCSLTRFRVEGKRVELLAVNDTQHLSPALVTSQPPSIPVEIAKDAHPAEMASVSGPPVDKGQ